MAARSRRSLHGVFGERAPRLGQRVRPFRCVDIPVRVDRDAFASRPLIHTVFALERRNERGDAILVEGTDAHTVAPVRVVQRTRLRVDRVDRVALDEDPADAAVHVARLEVLALLVENLEPMVAAIRHPETALRIEHHGVRCPELSVSHAELAPGLDELPVGRELADPRRGAALDALGDGRVGGHPLAVVPVGDVDAAVRPDDDVVGLIELAIGVARLAGDAEAQKLLALRAELVDLMALGARPCCPRSRQSTRCPAGPRGCRAASPSRPCRSSPAPCRCCGRT